MAPATVDDAGKLNEEDVRVTFTNSNSLSLEERRNGKTTVDVEDEHEVTFSGMHRAELMEYVNDPFWIRLRWGLFISFWACWFLMLISAIVIVVRAPRCTPLPTIDWWQSSAIYQIYPLSFQDSNGDGFGDLKGIESRVDYLSDLGVSAVWLNPIYKSPMVTFGYDIEDYKEVDPIFGDLDDFESLVDKLEAKSIKVILDFVPNHSGVTSVWFENSRNRIGPYDEYYVWHDGKMENGIRKPPNNWLSVGGGSAWTFDEIRKQYYLHQFQPEQPDLNLRSKDVQEELLKILTFWMDLGVRGFRVDAAAHLFEDISFTDEPTSKSNFTDDPDNFNYLEHKYTMNLQENVDLVRKWRKHLNSYAENYDTGHIFLTVEDTGSLQQVMKMYGSEVSDFPLNFELIKNLNNESTADDVEELIRGWLNDMPDGVWPNWVLGNHDQRRISDRVNPKLIDGLHMITTLLTGTPVTYYGEEIGMRDIDVMKSKMKHPAGFKTNKTDLVDVTDPFRSPMQWNDKENAGFTNASVVPWLTVHPNHKTGINVKDQLKANDSHIHIYTKLLQIREEKSAVYGSIGFLTVENVFGLTRVKKGFPGLLVLVNFGNETTELNLEGRVIEDPINYVGAKQFKDSSYAFPRDGMIELCSVAKTKCSKGKVSFSELALGPKQAVLVQFVPNFAIKVEK